MNLSEKLFDLVEKGENRRKLRRIFYIVLAITFISDFFIRREHVEFVWQAIPGFASFYGFISCIFIIVFSKWIGHRWLMKEEDYYD
ncbi:hypothetical protein Asulf_01808 [Archaeoglobus sulfaticallidus PM70-1]|uniref:Uncharacterized protein n=1 Tax=Archaeoglobus sulfaticallidus PM70-1 TaxID=387631 RepID=N0BDS0_9EURY|nr:hypothetical protein [Archaeoglobus sulfaticallidus]AGK61779.1 hypothetical protein Asulf_01808 [Archaeoglobus sulfaticallidus PM70-1]